MPDTPIFFMTTNLLVNLLERGLIKKKYKKTNSAFWQKKETCERIGGGAIWISPNNTHAMIIYYDLLTPIYAEIHDTADGTKIENALNQLSQHAENGVNLINQSKPDALAPDVIEYNPADVKILLHPHRRIKSCWLSKNLEDFTPDAKRRCFKVVVPEGVPEGVPIHYQFISHSALMHISFLRAEDPEGNVIAGGANAIDITDNNTEKYQTSFDLSLAPGIYYYEIYGYDFDGGFSVIMYDDCTNETERPHMYDDDDFDAFGNKNPDLPQKVDFFNPRNIITSDESDNFTPAEITTMLTNGSLQYSDTQTNQQYINNFNWVDIELAAPAQIKRVVLAGNERLRWCFLPSDNVLLQGRNDPGKYLTGWETITSLNDNIAPYSYPNWILDQTINYELFDQEYQYYRIWIVDCKRRSMILLTEVDVYI